ncbi:MAG: hypothetical protein M0Q44_22310 [Methylobacter sp.]|nr:hypothetical protein [Methylobacter sp.]
MSRKQPVAPDRKRPRIHSVENFTAMQAERSPLWGDGATRLKHQRR